MSIKVNGKELLKALNGMKGFTPTNRSLPILNSVLFTVEGTTLTISATDLDVAVTATLTSEAEPVRSFSLPIKALSDALKGAEGEAMIERVGSQAYVTVGSVATTLPCFDSEDFPKVLSANVELQPVETSTLTNILDKLLYAASEDETRFNLNSVFLQPANKCAVSTDGHRMVVLDNVELPLERDALVSRVALEHLGRVLKANKKTPTSMGLSTRAGAQFSELFIVRCGNVTITSRLVDGQFPDYKQVIPKKHKDDIEVSLSVEALTKAIKAVKPKDKFDPVTLEFKEGQLTLSSKDKDKKEAKTELTIDYTGKTFKIAFNPNYLADALSAVDGDTVHIQMWGEVTPALIFDGGNSGHKCVIMPMRI